MVEKDAKTPFQEELLAQFRKHNELLTQIMGRLGRIETILSADISDEELEKLLRHRWGDPYKFP